MREEDGGLARHVEGEGEDAEDAGGQDGGAGGRVGDVLVQEKVVQARLRGEAVGPAAQGRGEVLLLAHGIEA